MTGTIAIGICVLLLLGLFILFLNTRARYNELDEKYGKPYLVKLVKMIGGHPELKPGSMAISLHPKDVIAFNRKIFQLSQISSIKIITELPKKSEKTRKAEAKSEVEEQYLSLTLTDEYGEHEVIFTVKSNFNELANQVIQKWKKYLLFRY